MNAYVLSIVLVILSQVVYQLAVKSMPPGSNPLAVLIVVYGLAIAACVALAPIAGSAIAFGDLRRLVIWPSVMLALSVVGIEFGYLLAYRSGWKLGFTFAVASSATVATLFLLGLVWFGEQVDPRRVLGLVLVLAGGWCVVA